MQEALRKFAEEIKQERESKNFSVQQIANRTKIDVKFILAIEEARFDIMPDIYMRAFIKEYAATINLDPDLIIKKFDAARLGKTEDKQTQEEYEKKEVKFIDDVQQLENITDSTTNETYKNKNARYNFNFSIGAVAAFVVLILVYFVFIQESTSEIINDPTSVSNNTQDKPAFEIDTTKNINTSSTSALPSDSLQLSVNTLQRVWVKVLSDNKVRFEGMVSANSKLLYNAFKEFRVVVGNAGNVNLNLNGKPIKDVGKLGEIRNLIINADTVKGFTIILKPKNEIKSPESN